MAYLYPKTGLSEENLKAYLQTPPAGKLLCVGGREGGKEGGSNNRREKLMLYTYTVNAS